MLAFRYKCRKSKCQKQLSPLRPCSVHQDAPRHHKLPSLREPRGSAVSSRERQQTQAKPLVLITSSSISLIIITTQYGIPPCVLIIYSSADTIILLAFFLNALVLTVMWSFCLKLSAVVNVAVDSDNKV